MIELRKDKYSDKIILINTHRGQRPVNLPELLAHMETLQHKENVDVSPDCPFCIGNEERFAPEEYSRIPAPDGRWVARIVPNKYPGVSLFNDDYRYEPDKPKGYHDVFVESNRHNITLAGLSEDEIAANFNLMLDRVKEFEADKRVKNITVFKNYGDKGGASQHHPHWQLLASDIEFDIPSDSHCIQCDFIKNKAQQTGLEVYSDEDILVYAPFVSEYAYKITIIPVRHITKMSDFDQKTVQKYASMVKYIAQALESIAAPYNIYTSYNINGDKHLVTQIVPRIHTLGGFELATGININPVDPVEAVQFYKKFIYR